jgi:Uncharacterised nucleotidyltransferase
MQTFRTDAVSQSLGRPRQLREAILLTFCEPVPAECDLLWNVSDREWKQLLYWLDTSGLALYFLDRMTQLELCEMLPQPVLSRLQQNLVDNTGRMEAMIGESTAIQQDFQNAGLSYAMLKGFSLWPISVPKLELRSQLDLDFLITETNAAKARQLLEDRGYVLQATSGRSLEFHISQNDAPTLKDLYKATQQRKVELHIETGNAGSRHLLPCVEKLCLNGVCMPVLPPTELFLGQGLHLYKHVCSESFRVAHLIEFRRHIIARYDDDPFWRQLRELAEDNPRNSVGLGLVILLISSVMGNFAPEGFTCWTVDRLPAAARLWVELYGHRAVFAGFHGSKLYLLLQKELQQESFPAKRSVLQALLPRRLPPVVMHGAPGETVPQRIRRYCRHVHFIFFRLRFHVVEGFRFLGESVRWRQHLNELERSVPNVSRCEAASSKHRSKM